MASPYNIPLGSRDVIGSGMRSPFSFSVGKSVRAVTAAQGIDKIIASIQTILKTRPGERFMQPEFGSRLYDLVFEPNDRMTNQLLYYYTVDALQRWERRIKVTHVRFQTDETRPDYIGIVIEFYILQTHQQGSYVFPFEKTGMSMPLAVTGSEAQRIFTKGMVLPIQGRE